MSAAAWSSLSSRRWQVLVLLAVSCSLLYVLLYYRVATPTSPLLFLRSRHHPHPHPHWSENHTQVSSVRGTHSPGEGQGGAVGGEGEKGKQASSATVESSPDAPRSRSSHKTSTTKTAGDDSIRSVSDWRRVWGTQGRNRSLAAIRQAIEDGRTPPLLTLFTTWTDRAHTRLVHALTLLNWAQLRPFVLPVLFTNDSALARQAREHGWDTLPVSRAAIGIPVLKYMYLDAMSRFNSTLFAYANGDLLFTDSLLDTLLALLTDRSLLLNSKSLFVIGQRTNVKNVTREESLNFHTISKAAKARGKIFIKMAEDYFITDRNFPWDTIPGVVIGRVAYDNWLVLHAIQTHQVAVDATNTVLAVHQTTEAGNYEGYQHENPSYNHNLLTKLYNSIHYMGGCVDCTPWITVRSPQGTVAVEKRQTKPKNCSQPQRERPSVQGSLLLAAWPASNAPAWPKRDGLVPHGAPIIGTLYRRGGKMLLPPCGIGVVPWIAPSLRACRDIRRGRPWR